MQLKEGLTRTITSFEKLLAENDTRELLAGEIAKLNGEGRASRPILARRK
jgi:hypothetical protein